MKKAIKYVITFIATLLSLFVLLCIVNLIPQSFISKNINESMDKFETYENTKIFNISQTESYNLEDIKSLQILFFNDNSNVIKSTLSSNYNSIERFGDNYLKNVKNMMNINSAYDSDSCYWNGMNIILRPLFVLFNLTQIKIIFTILFLLLTILFIVLCEKNNLRQLWVAFIIGFIVTSSFFAASSIYYIAPLFVSLVISIYLLMTNKEHPTLFVFLGVITAFFDKLTTETNIFIIVFLTVLLKTTIKDKKSITIKQLATNYLEWLISLFLTLITKWGITYLICGKVDFSNLYYVLNEKISILQVILSGFYKNICRLLPMSSNNPESANMIIFLIIIIVIMVFLYTYKARKVKKSNMMFLFFISLIPIIRLLAMPAQTYLYSFYTFRTLFGTVMCIVLMSIELTGIVKTKR